MAASSPDALWLPRSDLDALLGLLRERGFRTVGPTVRDEAITFDDIRSAADLPIGWRDEQAPGRYRLRHEGDARVFGVVHGPGAIKPFVFAPREQLLEIESEGPGRPFEAHASVPREERVALLGVRPCDLAALAVQDRVFLGDRYPDPWYASRRRGLLLVAVSCTRSVSTCFCTSFGTGPEATGSYDLALTELDDGFVLRAGSPAGLDLCAALRCAPLDDARGRAERAAIDACAAGIERRLETRDLPDLLYDNLSHPRFDAVAERCLSCGNCTQVCPTCFCHDERDELAVDGRGAVRVREWHTCFDREHAQVHGINFRPHVRERYRQWLVHKLASWIDQFGTSGCVGCGRCITWCPVGIDLTEEVAAIREDGDV